MRKDPIGTRRAHGSGGVAWSSQRQRWRVRIQLRNGRCIQRLVRKKEEAEELAARLIVEHFHELGRGYYVPGEEGYGRSAGPRPRSGVTPRIRFAVLERDRFRCRYCGATAEDARLVIDHILPVAVGGSDDMDNLATACDLCNAGKAAKLVQVPA